MRWQGGANAGHTVVEGKRTYAFHQVPSAILIPETYNLMGEGVFLEPRGCLKEINRLQAEDVKIDEDNFGIASNAHVTLDYHILGDRASSNLRVGHTSTGRGIKQTAVDKYGREGIRFQEFLNGETFLDALVRRFPKGMPDGISHKDFVNSYLREIDGLRRYSVLQTNVLSDGKFKFGIGEGAQGFQLDVDRGLYPGVTSSNPSIVPFKVNSIVGVVKRTVKAIIVSP